MWFWLQQLIHLNCNHWLGFLFQLLELLDLKDYPILGYTMPRTLTELHCHLWSCAIDYRYR